MDVEQDNGVALLLFCTFASFQTLICKPNNGKLSCKI